MKICMEKTHQPTSQGGSGPPAGRGECRDGRCVPSLEPTVCRPRGLGPGDTPLSRGLSAARETKKHSTARLQHGFLRCAESLQQDPPSSLCFVGRRQREGSRSREFGDHWSTPKPLSLSEKLRGSLPALWRASVSWKCLQTKSLLSSFNLLFSYRPSTVTVSINYFTLKRKIHKSLPRR